MDFLKRRRGGDAETGSAAGATVETTTETTTVAPAAGQRPAARATAPMSKYGPFLGSRALHLLSIEYEHHADGQGEDAKPINEFYIAADDGLVGVFDGLGGAGGETIRTSGGSERTGAWLASRRVRSMTYRIFDDLIRRGLVIPAASDSDTQEESDETTGAAPKLSLDFAAELKRAIGDDLVSYAAQLGAGVGGRLKSRLIRTLPTTAALCRYNLASNELTAIWAGDSRVYTLRPDIGLQQVTTDDLKYDMDAMENLTQDSPMSNCISASTDFVLHERQIELHPQAIVLAASDGCFGYVSTPLHFEFLLLSTMTQATSMPEWHDLLCARIKAVTSDDSTMAAAIIGWPDFSSMRESFVVRQRWCEQILKDYDECKERVKRAELELDQARHALAAHTGDLWTNYRKTYEILNRVPVRDVPDRSRAEAAPRPSSPHLNHEAEPGRKPEPAVVADGPRDAGGESAGVPEGDGRP